MPEEPADFFFEMSAAALARPDVATGTMMGFPCLRSSGAFFASCERGSGDLIVKLPRDRVQQLIDDGIGKPITPAQTCCAIRQCASSAGPNHCRSRCRRAGSSITPRPGWPGWPDCITGSAAQVGT